jgi:hypothetical protein
MDCFDNMVESFDHYDEEERREGFSFPNVARRCESLGWNTIDENREEGRGGKTKNPVYPGRNKAKSKESGFHIVPA